MWTILRACVGGTGYPSMRDWRREQRQFVRRIGILAAIALPACNYVAGIEEPFDQRPDEDASTRPPDAEAEHFPLPPDAETERASPLTDATALPQQQDASDDTNTDRQSGNGDARPTDTEGDSADGAHDAAGHDASVAYDAGTSYRDQEVDAVDAVDAVDGSGEAISDSGADREAANGSSDLVTLEWSVAGPPDAAVRVAYGDAGVVGTCEAGKPVCSVALPAGTTVQLTASVAPGSAITNWLGCDSSDQAVCTVTLDKARVVSAQATRGYILRITTSGTGTGSVQVFANSQRTTCGTQCELALPEQTVAVLTAHPDDGSEFTQWSEGGSTNPRSVEMASDRSVEARFRWTPTTLSSLKLWLDASHGVQTNSNQTVARWDDRSRTATHFEPSDEASRPHYNVNGINGRPTIDFDGAQHLLNNTTLLNAENQDFVISVVGSNRTPAGSVGVMWNQRELSQSQSWDDISLRFTNNEVPSIAADLNGCWQVSSSIVLDASDSQYGDGIPHIYTLRRVDFVADGHMASSVYFRVDQAEIGGKPSVGPLCTGTGPMALGGRITPVCAPTCTPQITDFFTGQIAEVIYTVGTTSQKDSEKLEQYLAEKYGL